MILKKYSTTIMETSKNYNLKGIMFLRLVKTAGKVHNGTGLQFFIVL